MQLILLTNKHYCHTVSLTTKAILKVSYHFDCRIILVEMKQVLAHKRCIVVVPFNIE